VARGGGRAWALQLGLGLALALALALAPHPTCSPCAVSCSAAVPCIVSPLGSDRANATPSQVRGPLVLFQATLPVQPEGSKFVVVSSGAGTIGQKHRVGGGVYGQSKASVNYMVRRRIARLVLRFGSD
jgi:NAD(P)-dependent dehydrogenase (short-subunit alcohol dehydrogenase family)